MRANPISYFFRVIQNYVGGPQTLITIKHLTQSENLVTAMEKAGIVHGQIAVTNITGVTVTQEGGRYVAVFPDTISVEIVRTGSHGSSSAVRSRTAIVKGVRVSSTGVYDFHSVTLSAQDDHVYIQKLVDSRIELTG